MSLALFDFDGTITTKDSLSDFTQYAVGGLAYFVGLLKLTPTLIAYFLKLIPNHVAKEKFVASFFRGWNADRFQKLADRYSLEQIDKITRPKAIEKIRWHQKHGHKVVIVSASMECWLKAWCNKNRIDLISTKLEIRDNMLTGKLATRNCYGIEKVKRINETYILTEYHHIYAYGDSCGDKYLLALADESFYKPFNLSST